MAIWLFGGVKDFMNKVKGNMSKFYYYGFPMQATLVTCKNDEKINVITVAWHTTISKKPPLFGISIAPSRYSHGLIEESKEFVVNFASIDLVDKVNFCGTHSGRKTYKIKKADLHLLDSEKIDTPGIKECYSHLECKLFDKKTLGDHTFFIGEVVNARFDENAFVDGMIDNKKTKPCLYRGGSTYTTLDETVKKI
jgi:flavin reductase (DIM6/NTAB) family NADH-FMN oxidoreductase RutF